MSAYNCMPVYAIKFFYRSNSQGGFNSQNFPTLATLRTVKGRFNPNPSGYTTEHTEQTFALSPGLLAW